MSLTVVEGGAMPGVVPTGVRLPEGMDFEHGDKTVTVLQEPRSGVGLGLNAHRPRRRGLRLAPDSSAQEIAAAVRKVLAGCEDREAAQPIANVIGEGDVNREAVEGLEAL